MFSPVVYRLIASRLVLFVAFVATAALVGRAQAQKQDDADKHLDIQSSVGDLHLGNDADARKAGLPLYPGARLRHDEEKANLSLSTEAFGMKLVVAKYDSDDAAGKVIDYYRERLKKYGKVLECHSSELGGDVHADMDDDHPSQELKCEGDNKGPVTELKVGTKNNQHVVAIEPRGGSGSTFALVYVNMRGKEGDI